MTSHQKKHGPFLQECRLDQGLEFLNPLLNFVEVETLNIIVSRSDDPQYIGRREKAARTVFTRRQSAVCGIFATWECLPKWASRAWQVQNNTVGLNLLLPEQTACVEGIPLLNMPFLHAVQVTHEGAGLAFWSGTEIAVNEAGGLGTAWAPWKTGYSPEKGCWKTGACWEPLTKMSVFQSPKGWGLLEAHFFEIGFKTLAPCKKPRWIW